MSDSHSWVGRLFHTRGPAAAKRVLVRCTRRESMSSPSMSSPASSSPAISAIPSLELSFLIFTVMLNDSVPVHQSFFFSAKCQVVVLQRSAVGTMVSLHCHANGAFPPRPTNCFQHAARGSINAANNDLNSASLNAPESMGFFWSIRLYLTIEPHDLTALQLTLIDRSLMVIHKCCFHSSNLAQPVTSLEFTTCSRVQKYS